MAMVCSTDHFTHDLGVVGLAPTAFPRVVAFTTAVSEKDGALTTESERASESPYWSIAEDLRVLGEHRVLIDQELRWANTYPCDVQVIPIIGRARRVMRTTTMCVVMVRDSATVRVGSDTPVPVQAPDPDLAAYTSEWGHGRVQDTPPTISSTDWYARTSTCPEVTTWMDTVTVPEGQAISVRFRVGVALLHPFLSLKNDHYPEVRVHHNTIAFLALPSPQVLP